ncbi:MAG: Maf family nucleotide pyrophosphatase [Xanthomonadaceae bacterium]|nr:Maf family nucleotide pyrophosphatase [Xanthomonadaceae bacterium]
MKPTLILASASPRRRDLLAQAGIACEVRPADVDETPLADEQPDAYVRRLARAKAGAILGDGRPVLGADTAVVLDRSILGKPADAADAARMLRALSGREHEVHSAVALVSGDRCNDSCVTVRVCMRKLDDEEIAAYCRTGEPMDKAGAYAIQGRAAAFVERIDGSYTAVVGPIYETLVLLRTAGVTAWSESDS